LRVRAAHEFSNHPLSRRRRATYWSATTETI